MLYLRPDFAATLAPAEQQFAHLFHLQGQLYRQQYTRRTLRIIHDGKAYFLKTHDGVGWSEIFKNLFQLRLPIVSAKTEWTALHRLSALGIDTAQPVAYGRIGLNPARLRSFLITEEVGDTVTLEDLLKRWKDAGKKTSVVLAMKWSILRRVAEIARMMHHNGVNHRDFYLCHLRIASSIASHFMTDLPPIYVMDLHRAQLRRGQPPERWIVKDLAGLYFSSMDLGVTSRDRYRFIAAYTGVPIRLALVSQRRFWERVRCRALRMHRRSRRRGLQGKNL
jgi:lipopolysaccharide core heptose(I) kinase